MVSMIVVSNSCFVAGLYSKDARTNRETLYFNKFFLNVEGNGEEGKLVGKNFSSIFVQTTSLIFFYSWFVYFLLAGGP